ncbi:oxygen-dependent coproporphyrinogen oxidase [Sphingobacteriales bacterium UPWRP_1]|nr:coproporphyrinogen III oxidase [Sphingobacteriales bacterium TSM_CSM]PSJ74487.1 oxygen-dependent coproporphyrinogen oxidase [Sphingobacteriales bacterium UPWRP_1]
MPQKEEIALWFTALQKQICTALEQLDSKEQFSTENWTREGGGGGCSRVIQNGSVIEKGGVNFSEVFGLLPPVVARAFKLPEGMHFFATGVSIVLHPCNPHMPIIHMNVRYFEIADGVYWFGGGIDLTPHYIIAEDARYFHQSLQTVCNKHNPQYYPRFKQWADNYFYLAHRNETRGIGGIFFDQLSENDQQSKQACFNFVKDTGNLFSPLYTYFVNQHANRPFTPNQKQWQLIRRSRYVEFNLVYDKGTKFGLDTNGRTESILMSMPPQASWPYNYQPPAGSPEAQTLQLLKKDIDWVNYPRS